MDTSAWVAAILKRDQHHVAAARFLENVAPGTVLTTTDYVFDETVTRVRRLSTHATALQTGERLRASALVDIVRLTDEDLERAWQVFAKHADRELSFTDCTSVAVLERMKIRTVFAFDEGFRRLGFDVKPLTR